MLGSQPAPSVALHRKEAFMRRILAVSFALLFVVGLGLVPPVSAQTREETLIYSLQSDIDNWDPPNSVLRESIILGYHVFDHLAVRDLKTRKVGPNLATSWKPIDDTTWEVKLRQGVKFHDGTPFTAKVMQSEKVIREKGHDFMQENPIGTGPYKLVKWSRKQEHVLVRNDDYWGPKPAFKNVRIRIIPEQATQIAA